ncbi:MAG: aromatic acid exporter family protein [Bacillota bacterium]|nr:aromatic acid exporter family protein [Bacillota bacterium]
MNRYIIGGRVLKTVLAVTLAIYIAQYFELPRMILAALVALITVQKTFYHSLVQSLSKIGGVLLGGILGTTFSYFFGVSPLGYGLVTLVAIYICLQLRWQEHIVVTTVTAITIIFSGNEMPLLSYSIGQILTALIGAVCALTINYLFTPNHKKEVLKKIRQTEEGLSQAVNFIMLEMSEPGCDDTAFKELVLNLRLEIESGLETAKLFQEEQRFIINRETAADRYYQTFQIYSSQLKRLTEMHNLARRIPIKVPQAAPLIKFFRIVQAMQKRRLEGKKAHYKLVDHLLVKMEQSFEEMALPKSRKEFISRASLFHLLQEIKRYYNRMQQIPSAVLSTK